MVPRLSCLLVLLPVLARAEVDVPAAALAAAAAHEEFCDEAKADDYTQAGESIAGAGTAWGLVAAAYEASQDASLLYWRGVLALCIGREDAAEADLSTFVDRVGSDRSYEALARDARSKLRRLGVRREAPRGPDSAGLVLGLSLAAGSGATAALAGWQKSELQTQEAAWRAGGHTRAELAVIEQEGQDRARDANLWTGLACGLGGGALVAALVSGLRADGRLALGAGGPVLAVAPTPGGLALAFGGRW